MPVLPTLLLALATVPAQATTLEDVAALCSNPSDIEGTKSALLQAGWQPVGANRQAQHDNWISEIDLDSGSKTTAVVFERNDRPDYSISVSNRANPDGSWFRSCALKDPQNSMGLDLNDVKSKFGLENTAVTRIGPAHYWQNDEKKEYMLVLPTSRTNESILVIGINGED